jgi:hypothetical protein
VFVIMCLDMMCILVAFLVVDVASHTGHFVSEISAMVISYNPQSEVTKNVV